MYKLNVTMPYCAGQTNIPNQYKSHLKESDAAILGASALVWEMK